MQLQLQEELRTWVGRTLVVVEHTWVATVCTWVEEPWLAAVEGTVVGVHPLVEHILKVLLMEHILMVRLMVLDQNLKVPLMVLDLVVDHHTYRN